MKLLSCFFLLLLASAGVMAQTKPIAYRSHSGNMRYFATASDPDNLGWSGSRFEYTIASDTSLLITPSGDTTTVYPYCNNPAASKETLFTHFPLYSGIANADTVQRLALPEDTLAKPTEHIKSRHEKNDPVAPMFDGPGQTNNPFKPGLGIGLLFAVALFITGILIWLTNRKKVLAQ